MDVRFDTFELYVSICHLLLRLSRNNHTLPEFTVIISKPWDIDKILKRQHNQNYIPYCCDLGRSMKQIYFNNKLIIIVLYLKQILSKLKKNI